MRAVGAAPAWRWQARARRAHSPQTSAAPAPRRSDPHPLRPLLGMTAVFLAGYLGGILLCREQVPSIGRLLADYYMDKQNFAGFLPVFRAQLAGYFLQVLFLLLGGSSLAGFTLLPSFFAAKGAVLGVCAASVLAQAGTRGLVIYWLLCCLPDLAMLLLLLWVAQAGWTLGAALLQNVLDGSAVRGALKAKAQILLLRTLLAVIVGGCIAALGSGAAVLFASVLL